LRSFFLLRLLPVLIALVPPLVLVLKGYSALEKRLDATLKYATPGIAQEASRYLGRRVTIGKIAPEPSLALLQSLWTQNTLPLTVENLEIANTKSERRWAGQDFLARVPKVTAKISLPKVWAGEVSENAIEEITIDRPEGVLVRYKNGKFNVENILPEQPPPDPAHPNPPFRTRIIVQNGAVRVRDFALKRPQENFFTQATGRVEMSGAATIGFAGRAIARPKTPTTERVKGPIIVTGQITRPALATGKIAKLPYYVTIRTGAVSVAYTLGYNQITLLGTELPSGWAGGELTLVQGQSGAPQVFFNGNITDTTIRLPKLLSIPLTKMRANVTYTNGALRLEKGEATALGKTLHWQGEMPNVLAKSPTFALAIAPFSLTVAQIQQVFPIPKFPDVALTGDIGISGMQIIGTPEHPLITTHISGLSVGYSDLPNIQNVSGDVQFQDDLVTLANVQGKIGKGGDLQAQSRYHLTQKTGEFQGRLSGIDLTNLVLLKKLPVQVSGRGAAVVSGTIEGKEVTLGVKARGERVKIAGVSLPLSEVEGQYRGGSWRGIRAKLADTGSRITGSEVQVSLRQDEDGAFVGVGKLERGDLASLSQAAGKPGLLTGNITGEFTLSGSAGAPVVRFAHLEGTNVGVHLPKQSTVLLDHFSAPLLTLTLPSKKQNGASLFLEAPVQIEQKAARMTVRGEISKLGVTKSDPVLNLRAVARDVSLAQVLGQLAPNNGGAKLPPLTGLVTRVSAQATGPISKPKVTGDALLEKMVVGEYPIDSLETSFTYNLEGQGQVTLPKILAISGEASATASVMLSSKGVLSGQWETSTVRLESLAYFFPKQEIVGKIRVTGRLLGTQEKPRIEARVTEASGVQVAGIALEQLAIPSIIWQKKQTGGAILALQKAAVTLAGAKLEVDEARYEQVGSNNSRGSLSGRIESGSLDSLAETLRQLGIQKNPLVSDDVRAQLVDIPRIQGQYSISELRLSGVMTPTGLRDKKGHVALSVQDFQLGSYTQKSNLNLAAMLDEDIITLERPATLKTEETTLAAEKGGRFLLPKNAGEPFGFDLSVISNQASLDLIRAFVPNFPAQGLVDVSGTIQGTNEKPQIDLRVESESLKLGNGNANQMVFSKAEADVRVVPTQAGGGVLRVENVVLKHDKGGVLSGSVVLPYAFLLKGPDGERVPAIVRVPADQPLSVMVALKDFDLRTQITPDNPFLSEKVQGTLSGAASVTGTLAAPELQGDLSLKNAVFALKDVTIERGKKQSPFNIGVSPEIKLALKGNKIVVEKGEMGILPSRRRIDDIAPKEIDQEEMNLTLSGDITIDNLADIASDLSGRYKLKLEAENIAIGLQNITGLVYGKGKNTDKMLPLDLGERFNGNLTGTVDVTGPLTHPRIATRAGQPLELSKALLQLPIREGPVLDENVTRPNAAFQPEFAIETEIIQKAEIKKSGFLSMQVSGSAKLQGDILAPRFTADMETIKGDLDLRLLRFKVQPGGKVLLKYGGEEEGITVRNLRASAVVYQDSQRSRVTLTSFLPSGSSSRHTVTATMNGPLDILGTKGARGDQGSDVNTRLILFSAEPFLSQDEILRLIGIQDFLEGDQQKALQNGFLQVLRTSVLGTTGAVIENALRLDAFSLDFDPNGTTTVRLVRRLDPPNERFMLDFTRRFQPRGVTGNLSLSTYGIDYEILKFRERRGVRPQLQVGLSATSQRLFTYYLRGSVPISWQ
jgi:hypothetical protein